jgi:hypothetical protein
MCASVSVCACPMRSSRALAPLAPDSVVELRVVGVRRSGHGSHGEVLQHGQALEHGNRDLGPEVVRLEERGAVPPDGQVEQPAPSRVPVEVGGHVVGNAAVYGPLEALPPLIVPRVSACVRGGRSGQQGRQGGESAPRSSGRGERIVAAWVIIGLRPGVGQGRRRLTGSSSTSFVYHLLPRVERLAPCPALRPRDQPCTHDAPRLACC